jgi:sulfate adenylyltransferase subunit 2
MHIDTGHNFPEVIEFRDKRAAELGERLIVRSVEDSIKRGTVRLRKPEERIAQPHQSVTLLEAIEEFGFDACIGGARRDEEKARAKERIFLPRRVRPMGPEEPAPRAVDLYNARATRARTCAPSRSRTGPRWTCGNTSSAKSSNCRRSTSPTSAGDPAQWPAGAADRLTPAREGETVEKQVVRFRTVGDISCTCPVESDAAPWKIVAETAPPPSPSAAPPAWTTRPAKPPWNNARKKVTSDERRRPKNKPPPSTNAACCASSPPAPWTTARAP